jgi:hypothetical protein
VDDRATEFYVILGTAVSGLCSLGWSPQSILRGVEMAIDICINADPARSEAGRAFAESLAEHLGME